MAHIEIEIPSPDLTAALALTVAIVAIDVWAIRYRRSTISKWYAHQLREYPWLVAPLTVAMLVHLTGRWRDPLRAVALRIDQYHPVTRPEHGVGG